MQRQRFSVAEVVITLKSALYTVRIVYDLFFVVMVPNRAACKHASSSQFRGKINVPQKAVVGTWLTGQAAQKHLPV